MTTFQIKVLDKDGVVRCQETGTDEAVLVWNQEYQEGDQITVESSEKNVHSVMQLDDAMSESFVLLKDSYTLAIPFNEKRASYSPKSFTGDIHYLRVRLAREDEIQAYRNLALNVYDSHENESCFPHAWANVETRGESVFAARNAIDGVVANRCHGQWPFESWGINMQDDAEMTLEFGQEVEIDKLVLYTRADFPHDNWWTQVTIIFSDETSMKWNMQKSELPHVCKIEKKKISWLRLSNLIKADDPSPFPALTQIEVYGTIV